MNPFFKYYILSGIIMAIFSLCLFNKVKKNFEILSLVGLHVFVIINFFFGFIMVIPTSIVAIRWVLSWIKLNRLKRENEKLKKMHTSIIDIINKIEKNDN